jgi:exopolysaccharide production protein ExoQ
MTASWDSFARPNARPRRIRGGEIPIPSAISWREQQRRSRAQAQAQRKPAAGQGFEAEEAAFGFRLGAFWIDGDALFAFALFLPMVYLVQFGTMGAAMIAGVTPIYLFFRRRQLERVLAPRLFLFAFPAFALFSAVYSSETKETLKFALELCVTVTAATLLASAQNQRAVIKAIALAFFAYTVDAILMGREVLVGAAGGLAFSGLTQSKNLMAEIASTGMVASLAVVFMSLRWRNWGWLALFVVAALVELYAVMAARSAGALLGLAMGLLPLLVLSPLVSAGRPLRAWLTGAVALSLVVVALNLRAIMTAMIALGAQTFDKDPTLTGRTYLWYRAYDLIHEKPILGRGYFSFWLQGNIDAEGLWRYAGIVDRSGFNFHNTLVDLLVTVGWLGAGVLIVTVLIGAVALIRRFIGRPTLPLVFWIAILLYELARTPIETVGIQPFYFSTTLVFAALGVALGRLAAPRPAHRPIRSAVPVQVWAVDYAHEAWANPRLAPARGSLRLLRESDAEG